MTNEEIRQKIQKHYSVITWVTIDAIQNETRKDEAKLHEAKISELENKLALERERVIGEIEKWADEELGMPVRYYSKLIKLLNELRKESEETE